MIKKIINDKRILSIYVMIIFSLIIGVSYALGGDGLAVNVGTGLISVDESAYGITTFDSSNLAFVPILDTEVETSTNNVIKIDFTVGGASTNNNDNIIYDIALVDLLVNCDLLSPYIKWKLIKDGTELSNGSLDYNFDTIVDGRLVLTNIQQDLPAYNADKTGYHDYTFYMWFSDSCQESDLQTCIDNNQIVDQSEMLEKLLSGKIEVELYTESKKALVRKPSTTLDSSTCSNLQFISKFTSDDCTNVIYTGSEQNLIKDNVLNNGGITFTNYTAINVGNYDVTATLDSGYVWIDGTSDVISVSCPIKGVITYNGNGGITSDEKTTISEYVTYDSSYTVKENTFTNDNYNFIGWNTKTDGTGTNWTELINTSITWNYSTNITLYAQWQEKTYTISYNGNGNTSGSTASSTHTYGVAKNLTTNGFVKTGYTFAGWNTEADGSGTSYTDEQSVTNITETGSTLILYAKWTPIIYNISYTLDGGTSGTNSPPSATYDSTVTISNPSRSYAMTYSVNSTDATLGKTSDIATYTFDGWTASNLSITTAKYGTSSASTSWSSGTTKVKGPYFKNLSTTNGATVTLTANWTATSVTLPTISKTGYTCTWNTASNGSGTSYDPGDSYTPTDATTLYTICVANTYTVSYDGNGNTSGSTASSTHTYGVAKNLTTNGFVKTGHTFSNWNTASDGSGTSYSDGASVIDLTSNNDTVTLYAIWTPDTYLVTYNANGGSDAPGADTKTYGVDLELSSDIPIFDGYAFLGWSTDPSDTEATYQAGGTYSTNAPLELYAIWMKLYSVNEDFADTTYDPNLTIASSGYTGWSVTSGTFRGSSSYSTVTSTIKFTPTAATKLSFDYGLVTRGTLTITIQPSGGSSTSLVNTSSATTGSVTNHELSANVEYTLTLTYRGSWSMGSTGYGYIDNLTIN